MKNKGNKSMKKIIAIVFLSTFALAGCLGGGSQKPKPEAYLPVTNPFTAVQDLKGHCIEVGGKFVQENNVFHCTVNDGERTYFRVMDREGTLYYKF